MGYFIFQNELSISPCFHLILSLISKVKWCSCLNFIRNSMLVILSNIEFYTVHRLNFSFKPNLIWTRWTVEYCCQHVLNGGLLADICTRHRCHVWTLQQDGAPSHTAKNNTLMYLQRENVTSSEMVMWTPNSPDLNPIDYAGYTLQRMVYCCQRFISAEQLKPAIIMK